MKKSVEKVITAKKENMAICGNIKLFFFFPSYPVSTGFSLAWLLALKVICIACQCSWFVLY